MVGCSSRRPGAPSGPHGSVLVGVTRGLGGKKRSYDVHGAEAEAENECDPECDGDATDEGQGRRGVYEERILRGGRSGRPLLRNLSAGGPPMEISRPRDVPFRFEVQR